MASWYNGGGGKHLDKKEITMVIKPKSENNTLVACPEIAERWDWEKNDKGPEEYTRQSGQRVWLKCSKCRQRVENHGS